MITLPVTASARAVRHAIAVAIVPDDSVPERLGEISLRPHQRRAATRVRSIVTLRGGAMLAEPVGVGKTYTALAVAACGGGPIAVVAPASLRSMWHDAAARCGLEIAFASHESLSRGVVPFSGARFVIVDEAHRARSPGTRRYAAIAELCRRSPVLLLTATPVQNATADLSAQLGLFLGRVAWEMSEEELASCVVRDSGSSLGARPRQDGPHRVALAVDDDCLDLLLALPPPVAAKNETIVAALLTYGLLHQWTSSRAALAAALARRRARGLALSAAIEAGRRPTRAELSAWAHGGDAMQLAFPEIVAAEPIDDDVSGNAMLVALDRHGAAIDVLLRHLERSPNPDDARAAALAGIKHRHAGARVIAFCQYAETVGALWRRLAREPAVAALTANGARVAGGRIPRDAALSQFVARTERGAAPRVSAGERIDLLVTTDVLSEGLNLQEASVIVHLDLPWNPARLEQRVGRALRLGSRHDVVTVYSIAPPASAERLLRIEARLRDKLNTAQRTVGVAGRILPSPIADVPRDSGLAEQRSDIESAVRAWADPDVVLAEPGASLVAAVVADVAGFLAAVHDGKSITLVADIGRGVASDATTVRRAIAACQGVDAEPDERIAGALRAVDQWLAARRGSNAVDMHAAVASRCRRATLSRVAQALARAPRHRRQQLAVLATAAREVATAPLSEGAERILETLARSELPDEAWLRSIAAFGELNLRPDSSPVRTAREPHVVAMVLFGPPAPDRAARGGPALQRSNRPADN